MLSSKFPQPIYITAEIHKIESNAVANGAHDLMERAGLAAAELARKLLPDGATRILVLAGPGNNGGDAFVVARHLLHWWFKVEVMFIGDEKKLPPDAAVAHKKFLATGGELLTALPTNTDFDLIIDGIFGIGLSRDVSPEYNNLLNIINELHCIVLSLDIPSGIDADTGEIRGAAICASHTISFIALKPGLLTLDGPDHAGQLHIASLQLDAKKLREPRGHLLEQKAVASFLTPRPRNSHKGTYGSVGIIGGEQGMAGAALLAARAALMLGAGKVFIGMLAEGVTQLDVTQPELMWRAPEVLLQNSGLTALSIGCGMGQSDFARILLKRAIALPITQVIDADALNLIASDELLQTALKSRQAPTIITPHPAEAARLLNKSTTEIQKNRVRSAQELANHFNTFVVLKGYGSICAAPDGRWFINPTGNAGMASAGMGDVLSGIIAALLAQGLDAEQALLLGVYLHGAAADQCVNEGVGPVGLTASEVSDTARSLLNRWVS
jgi:ADP-dependent NAD(P)H-hydrate dehydratase / NAD(P)H-hydrate epimerase